jgi:hypothetical protein
MTPKQLETRKRLRDDFRYYAPHALKIRTKESEIKPLNLKKAQQVLVDAIEKQKAATGRIRVIILKARQQGLSTVVGGYFYFDVSQHEAKKALVVAHKSDSTKALFDMTKRFHDQCPAILKPSTKYSSKREIVFDRLDSSYMVATAGGDGIARGETITHLHASELAFWQASSARENWNGVRQAVPDKPGTVIAIESTANGVSGLFYELWKDAVAGKNEYVPVFIPWFWDPDYRAVPAEDFERTPDEEALVAEHGIDDTQLAWRRLRIAENGIELFHQEYPATPDEAFLTSGRPVFNPEQLSRLLKEKQEPLYRMALEGEEFAEHPRGELAVFEELRPQGLYTIGADISMGLRDKNGDWSVAQILDEKKTLVAQWRGQVHPDYFATILYRLGEHYNMAFIAPENNNHGLLVCHLLAKELAYPNIYQEVQHDKVTDKETIKLGFSTNVRTKPMIIDELRAAVRDGTIVIRDEETLDEMMTFVVTESGKMEAEDGCHDDCVMALAIANHVHEGAYKPVDNEDSFYVEMI